MNGHDELVGGSSSHAAVLSPVVALRRKGTDARTDAAQGSAVAENPVPFVANGKSLDGGGGPCILADGRGKTLLFVTNLNTPRIASFRNVGAHTLGRHAYKVYLR